MEEKHTLEEALNKIGSSLAAKPGRKIPLEKDRPKAAVSMLLKADTASSQLVTLLVKRTLREGDPWSGHMAFPGGRAALWDKDIFSTALRETQEETGIDLMSCRVFGTLDEIKASSFNICVTPFVALVPEEISVKPESREIDTFVWIPLQFFFDKTNALPYKIQREGTTVEVPSYRYLGQHVVWGMTFRIIQDFVSKVGSVP